MGCGSSNAAALKEDDGTQEQQFRSKYVLGTKLGAGAYGQVREVKRRDIDDGLSHAVKILDARIPQRNKAGNNNIGSKSVPIDKERLKMMKDEIANWTLVGNHPHVVLLTESFLFQGRCFMVMEKCEDTLLNRLDSMVDMSETDLGDWFYHVVLSLEPCHAAGVAHRDIKPDNFLIGGKDGKTVKLCDFGLSAVVPKGGSLRGTYGTPPYMSPEMLAKDSPHHGLPTDIWSVGSLVYLMLFGEFPYMPTPCNADNMKRAIATETVTMKFTRQGETPMTETSSYVGPSPGAVKFVKQLLIREESKRPTVAEVLRLPMMKRAAKRYNPVESAVAPPASAAVSFGATATMTEDEAKEFHQEEQEPGELMQTMRRARKHTTDFKRPANPVVQHTLDQVLGKLAAGPGFHRSFSDPEMEQACDIDGTRSKCSASSSVKKEQSEERITTQRSDRRILTHSGVTQSEGSRSVKDDAKSNPYT